MQRRQAVGLLGAALAIPFLPRSADAAIQLGKDIHSRLEGEADVPFRTLDAAQQALVADIAEAVIPETDTPGAKAVKVPEFIDLILTEWAGADEKTRFLAGLADIDSRAGGRYLDLASPKKTELLEALDRSRDSRTGAGFAFRRLKSLTVYGYFTSKVVDEQVLRTQMYFPAYRGDVPFTPAV